ncbi:MAG: hypothetical protein M1569_03900 [Candidatus Marsarchaeota archaeon]|nr:hypothetical protein [Candidatus Marsarchaeota archaeon]
MSKRVWAVKMRYIRLLMLFSLLPFVLLSTPLYASGTVVPCTALTGTNIQCGYLSSSNSVIDLGQYSTFTINGITGGIGPYEANTFFSMVPSNSPFPVNTQLASNAFSAVNGNYLSLLISANTANTLSICFPVLGCQNTLTTGDIYGVWTFNAYVQDSASNAITTNGIALTIDPALAVTLTPSNTLLDAGQYVTLTAAITGGTSPFTANLEISNQVTDEVVNTITLATSSSTSQGTTFYLPSWVSGNTIQANVVITDSASTNSIANSIYIPLGFNSIQTEGLVTESNTAITSGDYSRLTSNPSGGTSPYTIDWFDAASCSGTSIGSGATLIVNPTSTTTYSFNSMDSATANTVQCSGSNTITVSAPTTTIGCRGICGSGGSAAGSAAVSVATPPPASSQFNFSTTAVNSTIRLDNHTITINNTGHGTISVSGYHLSNMTRDATQTVNINGKLVTITVNFITPNSTGITLNGVNYTLIVGQMISISDPIYVDFNQLTYTPMLHADNFDVFAATLTAPANTTTAPATTTTAPNTTAPATTVVATTAQTTIVSVSKAASGATSSLYLIVGAVIVILIILYLLYMSRNRKGHLRR